ncbi:MAG: hypothetical protein GY820_22370 [Gammaproteobacteria bacterium]|nr:hypothetical protein [Gammaproteobacteria bacterium]
MGEQILRCRWTAAIAVIKTQHGQNRPTFHSQRRMSASYSSNLDYDLGSVGALLCGGRLKGGGGRGARCSVGRKGEEGEGRAALLGGRGRRREGRAWKVT